jgi:hypothetical protein
MAKEKMPDAKEEKGRKRDGESDMSRHSDVAKRVMDSTVDPMGAPRNEPKGERKREEPAAERKHGEPKMDRKRDDGE